MKQNKEIISLAVSFVKNYIHSTCAGFEDIIWKLLETGEVVASSKSSHILGCGWFNNFVDSETYDGGVNLYKWTLNQDFWGWDEFEGFVEINLEKNENLIKKLEKELEEIGNKSIIFMNFLNGKN